MNNWTALLVAIIFSALFRLSPMMTGKKIIIKDDSLIMRFLEYTSLAIIGVIIYSVGFSNQGIGELLHQFNRMTAIKIIILAITFLFSIYQRSILLVFIVMTAVYGLIIFFIPAY